MSKQRAKKKRRRRERAAGPRTAATSADAVRERRERAAARAAARGDAAGGAANAGDQDAGVTAGGASAARAAAPARRGAPARPRPRFEVRDGVERPQPIWAPFPLTEIGILVGVVIFMLGYFATGDRSPTLLGVGAIVLVIVVGELCLREHFAGFRPHSILLALLPVTVVHTFIAYAITSDWSGPAVLVAELGVAAGLAWWLQQRYRAARARATSPR